MSKVFVAALLLLIATPTFAADDDVSARKYQDNFGNWHVAITSHSDVTTITWVTVNRGNCKIINASAGNHVRMRFGQTYEIIVACNPIETSISTESGDRVLTWDD